MSYAKLNSSNVIDACNAFISEIDRERKERIERWIADKMQQVKPKNISSWFFFSPKVNDPNQYYSREEAEAALDEVSEWSLWSPRSMIMQRYENSYRAAKRLRNLSSVCSEIEVSVDDFNVIKDYFPGV